VTFIDAGKRADMVPNANLGVIRMAEATEAQQACHERRYLLTV